MVYKRFDNTFGQENSRNYMCIYQKSLFRLEMSYKLIKNHEKKLKKL